MRYLIVFLLLASTCYADNHCHTVNEKQTFQLMVKTYGLTSAQKSHALVCKLASCSLLGHTSIAKSHTQKQLVVKQSSSIKQSVVTSSVQTATTKKTYGSMKKPYKTITIDVYHETDVKVEQRQQQIAALIAQLKQLQESKVTVDPKFKVIVR